MSKDFRFKQFLVQQQRAAMKVGTDGVLLGAWMRLEPSCRRVLDIGTGTGLVALMAAQRTAEWGAEVVGVEIDAAAAEDAAENFNSSPWNDRLQLYNSDIKEFSSDEPFDHVVSNPPYFVASLTSPDAARSMARHSSEGLSFDELACSAARLLSEEGLFTVVLPTISAGDMVVAAARRGLFLARRMDVSSKTAGASIRVLLEFSRRSLPTLRESLTIHLPGGDYSPEYKALTQAFYLNF